MSSLISLSSAETEDGENLKAIISEAKKCDTVVYAPGVGKAKNKDFQNRSTQVLTQLKPYEKKLKCISNKTGSVRLVHPLTPCVREWTLSPFKTEELLMQLTQPTEKKNAPCSN